MQRVASWKSYVRRSPKSAKLPPIWVRMQGRQRATKAIGECVLLEGSWHVKGSEISWRVGTVRAVACRDRTTHPCCCLAPPLLTFLALVCVCA